MDKTVTTTVPERKSSLPALLFWLSLLLLIFLFGFYYGNCLGKKPNPSAITVLGVSTFTTSASKSPVINGEEFTFNTTAVADQNGILNATVKFDLSGQGVINNNIHGPGTCLKVTDTTAVCNNVNVEANQTASWTVPVSPKSTCSTTPPSSLSFQAQLIAPVGTFTSQTAVNCVASQGGGGGNPTATPTPGGGTGGQTGSPTPTITGTGTGTGNGTGTGTSGGTGGQTGTGTEQGGGTGATGGNQAGGGTNPIASLGGLLTGQQATIAGLACYRFSNGLPLVFLLFILWLIAVLAYVFYNRRERRTVVTEVVKEKEENVT